jgi:hypothetical protein
MEGMGGSMGRRPDTAVRLRPRCLSRPMAPKTLNTLHTLHSLNFHFPQNKTKTKGREEPWLGFDGPEAGYHRSPQAPVPLSTHGPQNPQYPPYPSLPRFSFSSEQNENKGA